jgi:integrase
MSSGTINGALARLGYKDILVGHGFRHLASTLLNELGFEKHIVEAQMSHKEPGVAGIYNKALYLPECRRIMMAWADYLDGLRTGANVVPIRKASAASR